MAGAFNCAKIVSNTVLLKLEADERFLDFLKTSVKNNFASSVILRRSIFIFSRENERHRRKTFLTWAANLLSKDLLPYKHKLLSVMLNSCDLPINIQIVSKNQIIAIKKAYVYFNKEYVEIKCFSKQDTLFSYIKAALKNECIINENIYSITISSISVFGRQKLKNMLSIKLFLGLDSFESFYAKSEFEKFFNKSGYVSGSHDIEKIRKEKMLSIMGTSEISSIDMLKKRYYELAKLYHPDLHNEKTESEKAELTIKFLKVKEAYETLCKYVA